MSYVLFITVSDLSNYFLLGGSSKTRSLWPSKLQEKPLFSGLLMHKTFQSDFFALLGTIQNEPIGNTELGDFSHQHQHQSSTAEHSRSQSQR